MASELSLHCLRMSPKQVSSLKGLNKMGKSETYNSISMSKQLQISIPINIKKETLYSFFTDFLFNGKKQTISVHVISSFSASSEEHFSRPPTMEQIEMIGLYNISFS